MENSMNKGNGVNNENKKNFDNVRKFIKTTIQQISISQIFLGKYQKRLNKKRVADIVATFNPNRMRPIEVSLRDGKYWCWDGQHRLAAYKLMGLDTIECQVHHGLTYEDEARLFAQQQDNVGSITSAHKWNALTEACDSQALAITKKCGEYGFRVSPKGMGGRNIRAVKSLQNIVKDLGINRLGDIVWLMASAWDHEDVSTSEYIVSGLALFMKKYLVTEQSTVEHDYNDVVINRLHTVLSGVTARALLQKSTNLMTIKGGSSRVALTLVDMFNKNLRNGTRLKKFDA